MATTDEIVRIATGDSAIDGTLIMPGQRLPGVLFVHGWGGSQERDLDRARGIAGLGCVCLTFDLRESLEFISEDKRYLLTPIDLEESGSNYEIGRYRESSLD